MFKLFLDPGHGGSDPGAVANGLLEKDLTLSIATKIKDILAAEYTDVTVKMSRTGDTFPSLNQRVIDANNWGADFYLSIHINAGGGTGFESYRATNSGAATQRYQSIIHDEIAKVIELTNRGKKQASYYVIRHSQMPALLTENGFIDTTLDASKMKDPNWINAVARGHVTGLEKSFSLKRKSPASSPSQPTPNPQEEGELFQPSNQALRDAVSVLLLQFSEQAVHGEGAISPEWRNKFTAGKLTVSDGLALLYIAAYRGLLDKRDGSDL